MAASTSLQTRNVNGGNLQPVIVTEILDPVSVTTDPGVPLTVVQPNPNLLNINSNIQVGDADVATGNPVPLSEIWRVSNLTDVTADDSDKSFTVPANREYQILYIRVNLTTTATATDRQLEVRVEHAAGTLVATLARAGAVQAPSLAREYIFGAGLADLTGFRDTDFLTTPLPNGTVLYAGDVLRILDNNAVDAAADDMLVHIQIASRAV